MASSIIASDNIGGTLYEYRIAKVPRDGPEFQIQTRWERTTGNYAPWEGAAMGYYHTEKEALNSFLPRYRYGTDTNLEPLHPTIKAMADKRTREARIIAEGRKVADAKAIEDRRVDFERVSSLKTEFALATFKSNTVEIKGEKGIVLDTQKGPSIGGLTITKVGHVRGGPGYVLTHNKTGHAASPEYPTLRHAKVAAFRLTQVADFNQNLAELQATKIPFGVIANSLKVNEFIDFSDKLPPPAVLPARTLDTTPPKLITEKTKLDAKKVADRLYSAAAARGFTEGLRERPRVTDADIKKATKGTTITKATLGTGLLPYVFATQIPGSPHGTVTLFRRDDKGESIGPPEPTMEERKVTAPTTRVKDVPSLSFRAAESRFNTKTAGTGRSKRRNPVADAKRQAKVIAPAVPETAEDLALQKKWFANPNQLDFEGIDHPNPRPRSQSGANIRSRRM